METLLTTAARTAADTRHQFRRARRNRSQKCERSLRTEDEFRNSAQSVACTLYCIRKLLLLVLHERWRACHRLMLFHLAWQKRQLTIRCRFSCVFPTFSHIKCEHRSN